MIRTQKLVPKVYYNHSRDFQLIGRLYELVLNSVKTNSDLIYNIPNGPNMDNDLLELLSTTIGFKSTHNYNVDQLKSLCSCFAEIIRSKGSIRAIEKTCNALVGAEGITDSVYIDDKSSKDTLILYVPQELSDTNLLKDLMNYILPAGLSYTIVKTLKLSTSAKTTIKTNSDVKIITHGASKTSTIKDTFNATTINAPDLLDTGSMLINSTIIDAYGYEIQAVKSMPASGGTTKTMKNGYIVIKQPQFTAGSEVTFEIHCESGYKVTSTNSLWFTSEDSEQNKLAHNWNYGGSINIKQSTDIGANIWTVTISKMPNTHLKVLATISKS